MRIGEQGRKNEKRGGEEGSGGELYLILSDGERFI